MGDPQMPILTNPPHEAPERSANGGGITVATGAGDVTISSNLTITGLQTFNIGTGRTLALNTGTFTRTAGQCSRSRPQAASPLR